MNKKELGKYGEEAAKKYLINKGYQILHRNWRFKQDEIDIIAKKAQWLIFIEVKTRTSTAFGKPHEFVDSRKENALIRAADAYVHENKIDENIRFDIISILVSSQKDILINHIEFAIRM